MSSAGQRRRRNDLDLSERYTRQVLDLTIRLAEVMLSSGSGTADVVATAQDVARAYRLFDCVVDITFTTIIVSAQPTPDADPVTLVRAVRGRGTDYSRLADLDALVRRISVGGVTPEAAHQAMDELTERPHPYPRWIATAAWAGFALGVAMLLGGSWLTCVLAAVTTAAIDRLGRLLNRARTPFFFLQAAGAAVATAIAVLAFRIAGLDLPTLVATGIVVLLSGLTLVGAVQDALTGYMVTATARLGDVIFMTAGIVVGIVIILEMSTLAGMHIELRIDAATPFRAPDRPETVIIAVLGATLAGVCLMIAGYAPARSLPAAGMAAGIAELLVIIFASLGFGQVLSSGLAAVAVGLAATTLSIRRRASAELTVTAGITPLLPGLAVFRAVFAVVVTGRFDQGLGEMLAASAVALALGSGVVMGEFLSSPLRVGAGWLGRALRVDDVPGLRRAIGVGDVRRAAEPPAGRSTSATGSLPLGPVGDGVPELEDVEDAHPDVPGAEDPDADRSLGDDSQHRQP